MKKITMTMLLIFIMMSSSVGIYAKDIEKTKKDNTQVTITKNNENSETINLTKVVHSKKMADILVDSAFDQFEDGKEYVVETYEDGTSLVVVAEKNTGISSNSILQATALTSETATSTFKYYEKNILGVKTLAYKVVISASYYDGTDGYIVSMNGTWTRYISTYTLSWNSDYSFSSDVRHTLGLDVKKGLGTITYLYTAWYTFGVFDITGALL